MIAFTPGSPGVVAMRQGSPRSLPVLGEAAPVDQPALREFTCSEETVSRGDELAASLWAPGTVIYRRYCISRNFQEAREGIENARSRAAHEVSGRVSALPLTSCAARTAPLTSPCHSAPPAPPGPSTPAPATPAPG